MSNEEKTNNTPKHGPGRVMEKPKILKKLLLVFLKIWVDLDLKSLSPLF